MDRPVVNFLRKLAAVALLGSLSLPAFSEERRDTRPVLDPPPPAFPQKLTVARGAKLDVQLRIYGVQNEPLRYLIKTPPRHGRLSEPRAASREVSIATYEPPSDLGVTADRFTYSVQSHAGVSAPVEVVITITDLPSRLAVPASIDFGELLAGDRAVKEIEVANRGGGLIEGKIEVDPPLMIEGRTTYHLEANDFTYFKIVFAPSEGGTFRREIRYTSDQNFITSVTGSAQAPVSAEPAQIEVRADVNSALRTGAFEIVNRTDIERSFKLNGGARLQVQEGVTVPAHGRVAIALSTRSDDVAALEDTNLRVESPGFALVVPVRGAVVGPVLRLKQSSIGLGRIDAARGGQTTVTLQNVGGTAAQITGEVSAPFFLPESNFELRAGEQKQVRLSIAPAEPQRYRTWLKFKAGDPSAELEVEAELINGLGAGAHETRSDSTTKAKPAAPEKPQPWMPDFGLARAIRVARVDSTSADIEWPLDMNGAATFSAQRLMLTRDSSHELRNAWVPIPKTKFAKHEPLWVATLSDLAPNQSQTIRIVALTPEGQPAEVLFQLDFFTLPKASLPKPRLVPSLFLALLITGALILFRRLRRHYTEPISGF